jgi:hypothetical protein
MTTKEAVQEQISKTKQSFLNAKANDLYDAFNGVSQLLLTFKQHGGKQGWSSDLTDSQGQSVYSNEEQAQLESSFRSLSPFIDPIFLSQTVTKSSQQHGGLIPSTNPQALISYENPFGPINPDDISIDKAYKSLTRYIDELDEKNRVLARTIGPFRFINELKIDPKVPLPPPLPPLSIPARVIIPAILTGLELLRLLVSFGPLSNDMLRKISSLVLAAADLANGSWKNALLTGAGVFGTTPLLLGIFGKLLNNTFELMSPEVRVTLRDQAFRGAKSAFIGFWLFMFSILAPDFVRGIVNTALEGLKKPLEEFNEKIGDLENKVQGQLTPLGLHAEFQRLPLDMLPSLEDIQNIQILASRPEIYCSPEFQVVLDPLMKLVPIRLALELMGVPSQDDDKAAVCSKFAGQTVANSVVNTLTPTITPIQTNKTTQPTQINQPKVGGRLTRSGRSRHRRRLRSSRTRKIR